MRVQKFYLHKKMLERILEEAESGQKKSTLTQAIHRERELLKQNQQQQEEFGIKFSKLCAHDINIPRWMFFSSHPNIILDVQTGMLWPNLDTRHWHIFGVLDGFDCWRLPFKQELEFLLEDRRFPLISGTERKIAGQDRIPISTTKAILLDEKYPSLVSIEDAPPFCVSSIFLGELEWPLSGWEELIRFLSSKGMEPAEGTFGRGLYLVYSEAAELIRIQRECEDRLIIGREKLEELEKELSFSQSPIPIENKILYFSDGMRKSLRQFLLEKDWRSARLPKLDESVLYDQNTGLWEISLSEPPTEEYILVEIDEEWEADPIENKIREEALVAIDFGTSNTVIAIAENENVEMLRLGLEDWFEQLHPSHYENPTLLEFSDEAILDVWKNVPHRPPMRWDELSASHSVKAQLQNSRLDVEVSRRVLSAIKLWIRTPLNKSVFDKNGKEITFQFPKDSIFDPTVPLVLGENHPIDPIELYAFYLGMSINTRQRGIHLQYYLTFPVQYTQEQRTLILSSFRLGLYRSLPASIASSSYAAQFNVSAIGSEPAAFAASLLEAKDEAPTKEGKAFAVFDFGGGTTDFAFGIWRKSQPENIEEWGNYAVIEHFSPSGDINLGGEVLLWQIVYRIYEQNIHLMRSNRIPLAPPPHDIVLEGMEVLLRSDHIAQSNVMVMMEKFRPLWERKGEEIGNDEGISITLRDHKGTAQVLELFIQKEELESWIVSRIYKGIQNFAIAMHTAFQGREGIEQIDVFLAGNSSRSIIVQALFGLPVPVSEESFPVTLLKQKEYLLFSELLGQIWKDRCPKIVVSPVLTAEGSRLNCKTGVALGIISLSPGRGLFEKAIGGEASQPPFSLFVGFKWGPVFHCVLKQNQRYHVWKNMGGLSQSGVFLLYYSSSPLSVMGDNSLLKMRRVRFEVHEQKMFVFVRAIGPYAIEVCVSEKMKIEGEEGMQHQRCEFVV